MNEQPKRGPLLLMILDGWGYREETENNAIAIAETPCWDEMWRNDPRTLIETSGESVGLPAGQMGNSEVGHMSLGSGRVIYQSITRIDQAIAAAKIGEIRRCARSKPRPCRQQIGVDEGEAIQEAFVPLRQEIEWGYNDIYGISGTLNQHPRDAMKQRANEKTRDDCYDFYVESRRIDDAGVS